MNIKLILIVAVGFAIVSCTKGRDTDLSDEISGAYAREYSFKVVNAETGAEIGMRTIRDTIFIRSIGTGYEVLNKKWNLNDSDRAGWQNMEHADDRPLSTYQAQFEERSNSLTTELSPPLFLDFKENSLFKDKTRQKPYIKVQ